MVLPLFARGPRQEVPAILEGKTQTTQKKTPYRPQYQWRKGNDERKNIIYNTSTCIFWLYMYIHICTYIIIMKLSFCSSWWFWVEQTLLEMTNKTKPSSILSNWWISAIASPLGGGHVRELVGHQQSNYKSCTTSPFQSLLIHHLQY